jgi:hypothetical protein
MCQNAGPFSPICIPHAGDVDGQGMGLRVCELREEQRTTVRSGADSETPAAQTLGVSVAQAPRGDTSHLHQNEERQHAQCRQPLAEAAGARRAGGGPPPLGPRRSARSDAVRNRGRHQAGLRLVARLRVSLSELLASPRELLASPRELSASLSELLASPSELLASPSELLASPRELSASLSEL